ncbi:MAG: hypothetical protein AAF085_12615, partial [Planctomycetota bacterium]
LLPLKILPLMRLGDARLAEELYAVWTATEVGDFSTQADHDPYLPLAGDWTWASFDRAVCAHMRSDDKLALASTELLMPAWRAIEAAAKQRG